MTSVSQSLGIPLGRFVSLVVYDEVASLSWKALPNLGHRELFTVGWTGLGYRALASSQHCDAFLDCFRNEPSATHLDRFEQDNHFFGFVTNASAAAENLIYACFIAALGLQGAIPSASDLAGKRKQMVDAIKGVPATEALGLHIERQAIETRARSLFERRDVVLHRGRLARNHFVGGPFHQRVTVAKNPKAVPTDWDNTFVFDGQCLEPWVAWTSDFITTCSTLLLASLKEPEDAAISLAK